MKRGDILICVSDNLYGYQVESLKIGKKYQVREFIKMSEKNIVEVDSEVGEYVGLFEDRHFIHLDVWREFQLRKIL